MQVKNGNSRRACLKMSEILPMRQTHSVLHLCSHSMLRMEPCQFIIQHPTGSSHTSLSLTQGEIIGEGIGENTIFKMANNV